MSSIIDENNRDMTVAMGSSRAGEIVASGGHPLLEAYAGKGRLESFLRVPSSEEVFLQLQHRGVTADPELWAADASRKIDALTSFQSSFLATQELALHAEVILARVRRHAFAKNFTDAQFRLFYHRTQQVLQGGDLVPLPPTLASLKGGCLSIVGPSLMGKTAFLQRICTVLGLPFDVELQAPAWSSSIGKISPTTMTFIPSLNLNFPKCNTVSGFLRDMRERLVAAIGKVNTPRNALADLMGSNGENAAIAACILLNVCLITVDGANFSSINGDPAEIPRFLLKLQQYTGIPILLACTSSYEYFLSLAGSLSSNLFSEPSFHLDPIEAPLDKEGITLKNGIWYQKNKWYWSLGCFSRDIEMPDELPVWTYEIARGREGWLAEGFESLHLELIKKPDLLKPGALTKMRVMRIFEMRLRTQKAAREVVEYQQKCKSVQSASDFYDFADHFPIEFIRLPKNKKWMSEIGGLR